MWQIVCALMPDERGMHDGGGGAFLRALLAVLPGQPPGLAVPAIARVAIAWPAISSRQLGLTLRATSD
jgi:hypothetical protein